MLYPHHVSHVARPCYSSPCFFRSSVYKYSSSLVDLYSHSETTTLTNSVPLLFRLLLYPSFMLSFMADLLCYPSMTFTYWKMLGSIPWSHHVYFHQFLPPSNSRRVVWLMSLILGHAIHGHGIPSCHLPRPLLCDLLVSPVARDWLPHYATSVAFIRTEFPLPVRSLITFLAHGLVVQTYGLHI
jgi:hypothetical protein